ncbi:MAG: hypothetical protein PHT51_00400 [Patescibacteria group bacterium]|nr:hypothetical protein [Patescibacteria group bacterium]MDD4611045.1 hypothetical protein [Patescibacteria group bacterium]
MKDEIKIDLCVFLKFLKKEVDLFTIGTSIEKKIIPITPELLQNLNIERRYLKDIIRNLKKENIIKEEIRVSDEWLENFSTMDIVMPFENLKEYSNYNIILTKDFYKNYDVLIKKNDPTSVITKHSPRFDEKNHILYFAGKKIDFSKKSKQYDLLAELFKDPQQECFYADIQNKWEPEYYASLPEKREKESLLKRFNGKANNINQSIARETAINDFLKYDMKKVRINPKYIH